jgi:hypothetical protein
MSSTLVLAVYVAALAAPLLLLYFYRSRAWYWHMLAVIGAFVLGFVPTPPAWKTPALDMAFGVTFIFLLVWGIGGLLMFHQPRGHHKHA